MGGVTAADVTVVMLLLALAAGPLGILNIVAYRSRRRGWWLAAPWLGMAGLSLLTLQALHGFGLVDKDATVGPYVMISALIAGWLSLSIYLIALAIVGPKWPPPGLAGHK